MEQQRRYRLVLSNAARSMLDAHIRFLAQRSVIAARQTKDNIIHAIASLRENPERFPFLDGYGIPGNVYHKMFVKSYYLVLFQIRGDDVLVDYIVDCRSDYSWLV